MPMLQLTVPMTVRCRFRNLPADVGTGNVDLGSKCGFLRFTVDVYNGPVQVQRCAGVFRRVTRVLIRFTCASQCRM